MPEVIVDGLNQRTRLNMAAAKAACMIGGGAFGACIQRHGWAEPMVLQTYRELFHQMQGLVFMHSLGPGGEWIESNVRVAIAAADAASHLCAGSFAGGVLKHGWTETMISLQTEAFFNQVYSDLRRHIEE